MTYYQWRLAKRNGEIVQQRRLITSKTKNKWWKPWEYAVEYDHGEWEDVEMVVIQAVLYGGRICAKSVFGVYMSVSDGV